MEGEDLIFDRYRTAFELAMLPKPVECFPQLINPCFDILERHQSLLDKTWEVLQILNSKESINFDETWLGTLIASSYVPRWRHSGFLVCSVKHRFYIIGL